MMPALGAGLQAFEYLQVALQYLLYAYVALVLLIGALSCFAERPRGP